MANVANAPKKIILDGRKCFLCHNTRHRSKQCRLFRFPARGTNAWNRWMTALALPEECIRPNQLPRLCQRHFEPKDFLTRQLSGMAVPVRNLRPVKSGPSRSYTEQEDNRVPADAKREGFGDEKQPVDSGLGDVHAAEETNDSEGLDNDSEPTSTERSCNDPQHRNLQEELLLERAQVEKLQKQNAQQRHIIEEQRSLLQQLGVECVLLDVEESE